MIVCNTRYCVYAEDKSMKRHPCQRLALQNNECNIGDQERRKIKIKEYRKKLNVSVGYRYSRQAGTDVM